MERAGIELDRLSVLEHEARNETDLGQAISEGKADAGQGVRAAAQAFHLDFVPLHHERCDLLVRRRDYFEPPVQRVLEFARTEDFAQRAAEMGGYDVWPYRPHRLERTLDPKIDVQSGFFRNLPPSPAERS